MVGNWIAALPLVEPGRPASRRRFRQSSVSWSTACTARSGRPRHTASWSRCAICGLCGRGGGGLPIVGGVPDWEQNLTRYVSTCYPSSGHCCAASGSHTSSGRHRRRSSTRPRNDGNTPKCSGTCWPRRLPAVTPGTGVPRAPTIGSPSRATTSRAAHHARRADAPTPQAPGSPQRTARRPDHRCAPASDRSTPAAIRRPSRHSLL